MHIDITYYMKNGVEIYDRMDILDSPIDVSENDIQELIEHFRNLIKTSLKDDRIGYIAMGYTYVRASEINACRIELVETESR